MDAEELRSVAQTGETDVVEFKSDRKKGSSDSTLWEVAVCLANGRGGALYVGVENDGSITGSRRRHGDHTDPIRVQAMIANNTTPQLVPRVEIIEIDDLEVIRIEVDAAAVVVGTRQGLYVRRGFGADGKPACLPFFAHEMLADRISRGEVDFASILEPDARMTDLDPAEFDRFRRLAREGGAVGLDLAALSDVDLLSALEVAELQRRGEPRLRRGALLLFGREQSLRRYVPTHETLFQVLRGGAVVENEIRNRPLFATAERLYESLRSQNVEEEVMVGLIRTTVPRIPEVVARELVANALVHRDFTSMGPVIVQIADDELTVTSTGGFPRGITLENYLENSVPRSRILANAFNKAGIVDRAGRGINKVFEATLRAGRPQPDYARSTNDRVIVSVELGETDLRLVRFLIDHDERAGRPFDLPELQVLRALRDDPRLTTGDIADVLQRSMSWTRGRLSRMLEDGLVEMRGDGRARRYTLSGSTYRRLASDAGYVRVRAFDEPQQAQMIRNFVEAHGSISRSEAAELCGTSPEHARRLLFRLRDAGHLVMVGDRRTSRYVLP